MRISIFGINYEPEKTGIAPYTTGMAAGLAARGHDVEVFTGLPHYPEWQVYSAYRGQSGTVSTIDEVSVRRWGHYVPNTPTTLNRVFAETTFGLRTATKRWSKPNVVLTVSPALLASAMVVARCNASRIPVGLIVQDLYGKGVTETAAMSGRMALGAARFEAEVMRRATGVAVVHDRFAQTASELGVDAHKVCVIRNWAHINAVQLADRADVRSKYGWRPDERIILHTGNMGAKQGLENVVAASRLADEQELDIRFVLVGDGNKRSALQQCARGGKRIEFKDPLGDDEYARVLASADVLLVNELPGVGEMAVPSKLTSYFSAGRPVLAATDPAGVTAGEVRDSQAGLVVSAGDPAALLDAAVKLSDDRDLGQRLGELGQRYARRLLGAERAIDEYEAWCVRLAGAGGR